MDRGSSWSTTTRCPGRVAESTPPPISDCAAVPTISTWRSWTLATRPWLGFEGEVPRIAARTLAWEPREILDGHWIRISLLGTGQSRESVPNLQRCRASEIARVST
jgi:hypothetical protein